MRRKKGCVLSELAIAVLADSKAGLSEVCEVLAAQNANLLEQVAGKRDDHLKKAGWPFPAETSSMPWAAFKVAAGKGFLNYKGGDKLRGEGQSLERLIASWKSDHELFGTAPTLGEARRAHSSVATH